MTLQPITVHLTWMHMTHDSHGSYDDFVELESNEGHLIRARILARKWGKMEGDGITTERQFTEVGQKIIIYYIDIYDLESGMEVEYNRTEMEKLIKSVIELN